MLTHDGDQALSAFDSALGTFDRGDHVAPMLLVFLKVTLSLIRYFGYLKNLK